jgi:acetate kinase
VKPRILTINSGSSSIRFALYAVTEALERVLHGKVERIGLKGTDLTFFDLVGKRHGNHPIPAPDHRSAAHFLLDWLAAREVFESVRAVGHRVVHGMRHMERKW